MRAGLTGKTGRNQGIKNSGAVGTCNDSGSSDYSGSGLDDSRRNSGACRGVVAADVD